MSLTEALVAKGASRVALRNHGLDKALWHMAHRSGYFRRRLEPTTRFGYGGAYPAHTWRTQLISRSSRGGEPRVVGGAAEGTWRTMLRCRLIAPDPSNDHASPVRAYRITERGLQLAEEHRAESRYPWWEDPVTVDDEGVAHLIEGFDR